MKREEVQARFEGITDEQLDWLMEQNGRDVNAVQAKLKTSRAANGDLQKQLEDLQAKLDDANKASMTAEERLQAQLKAAEDAQAAFAMKSSRLDARGVFANAGIPDESMDALLDLVANGDSEQTKARAEALVAVIGSQSEKAVAEAKKAMVGGTSKPKGGEGANAMTKADFMKLDYMEQLKLKTENPNLLNELR